VVETSGLGMWSVAPEFQILDDPAYVASETWDTTAHLTGDNYDLHAAPHRTLRAAGEWNQARIVASGTRVEHWLNGEKTVGYELWSPEWEALVAKSKFAPYRQYGRAVTGRIGLQAHVPGRVWYRNIKIRELPRQ
jgi:cytochrome c